VHRVRLAVVPLVLVAACSAGGSTSPAPPRTSGTVVAVSVRGDDGVRLYRVGRNRKAVLLSRVAPPRAGELASTWTLSGGERPDLCVVWDVRSDAPGGELWCYPFGKPGKGIALEVGDAPERVALRPDGKALAWTTVTGEQGDVQDLIVADYRQGGVKRARVLNKGSDKAFWYEEWVRGIAWASDHVLVLERPLQDDQPGGYELLDLNRIPPGGWGENALGVEPEPSQKGYGYFTGVQSATVDWVLAVEGTLCDLDCAGRPPTRAVRVAIGSGRLLEVVATAAKGGRVSAVSGALDGIVYTTEAGRDVRAYLRLKGEKRGLPVVGLPFGVEHVVAAP